MGIRLVRYLPDVSFKVPNRAGVLYFNYCRVLRETFSLFFHRKSLIYYKRFDCILLGKEQTEVQGSDCMRLCTLDFADL